MAYSNIDTIRLITGFVDDTKIEDDVITSAITEADSTINGIISRRYIIPLSETPALIQLISEQLAKAILYAQEYGEETENLDKGWKKSMDHYMGVLSDIASGKLRLLDSNGDELPRSTVDQPAFYPNDVSEESLTNPTFSRITVNSRW